MCPGSPRPGWREPLCGLRVPAFCRLRPRLQLTGEPPGNRGSGVRGPPTSPNARWLSTGLLILRRKPTGFDSQNSTEAYRKPAASPPRPRLRPKARQAHKALCAGADTARSQCLSPGSGTGHAFGLARGRNLTRMAARRGSSSGPRPRRGRPPVTIRGLFHALAAVAALPEIRNIPRIPAARISSCLDTPRRDDHEYAHDDPAPHRDDVEKTAPPGDRRSARAVNHHATGSFRPRRFGRGLLCSSPPPASTGDGRTCRPTKHIRKAFGCRS